LNLRANLVKLTRAQVLNGLFKNASARKTPDRIVNPTIANTARKFSFTTKNNRKENAHSAELNEEAIKATTIVTPAEIRCCSSRAFLNIASLRSPSARR